MIERFEQDGALHVAAALTEPDCVAVEAALADVPGGRAGVRLRGLPALAGLLAARGPIGAIAARILGDAARPVRALLFDKNAACNWALGWHQDRTIVVARRVETPGYGPWTVKAGLVQVAPPFAILENMVTLRVHLDPVDAGNAPLRIVPGSHRLGRIAEDRIDAVVAAGPVRDCLAARGDIWLYRTAIVHGSRAADPPRRRRVVQVDYAATDLPPPLAWRGI